MAKKGHKLSPFLKTLFFRNWYVTELNKSKVWGHSFPDLYPSNSLMGYSSDLQMNYMGRCLKISMSIRVISFWQLLNDKSQISNWISLAEAQYPGTACWCVWWSSCLTSISLKVTEDSRLMPRSGERLRIGERDVELPTNINRLSLQTNQYQSNCIWCN